MYIYVTHTYVHMFFPSDVSHLCPLDSDGIHLKGRTYVHMCFFTYMYICVYHIYVHNSRAHTLMCIVHVISMGDIHIYGTHIFLIHTHGGRIFLQGDIDIPMYGGDINTCKGRIFFDVHTYGGRTCRL